MNGLFISWTLSPSRRKRNHDRARPCVAGIVLHAGGGTRSRRSDRERRCVQTIWFCQGTHPASEENWKRALDLAVKPKDRVRQNPKLPVRQLPTHGHMACAVLLCVVM